MYYKHIILRKLFLSLLLALCCSGVLSAQSNLQIVFFKSRKSDDILIQALLNGFCATLPLPEAAPGFYHLSDFRKRFSEIKI